MNNITVGMGSMISNEPCYILLLRVSFHEAQFPTAVLKIQP